MHAAAASVVTKCIPEVRAQTCAGAAADATEAPLPDADDGGVTCTCTKAGKRAAAAVTNAARWVRALNAAGLNKA